jgi:hypothetical protein
MWKNMIFLALGSAKGGLQVYIGKWKGLLSKLHGVKKVFFLSEVDPLLEGIEVDPKKIEAIRG